MISRQWKGSLMDVRNKRSTAVASDHYLLISDIRMKLDARRKQANLIRRKRFNLQNLKQEETKGE